MRTRIVGGWILASCACLAGSMARAQDAPTCGPCTKVVCPTIEPVKHTRYCYDVKIEDYCRTRCAHTPILSIFCHDRCGKCAENCGEADPCHKCGKPRTRKVLIKEFVTEEVPTPRCRVQCTTEPCVPAPTK
jgi:hypothetical protein